MPLNEAGGYVRSHLTREQKREAEAAILGIKETDLVYNNPPEETDLNAPPKKPYVHQEFPKMVYHHGERTHKIVKTAEELKRALAAGWQTKPYPPEWALSEPETEPEPEPKPRKKPGPKPKSETVEE